MDLFRRNKPQPTPEAIEKTQHSVERLHQLIKGGATEVFIDDTGEYADLSEAMGRLRQTLSKPVQKVAEEVETEVKAVETAIKTDVRRVETAVSEVSMIRISKRVKERLKAQRQGKESYEETIDRLLDSFLDTSKEV